MTASARAAGSAVAALHALARPRLLPFVLALVALGYGLAHWDAARPLTAPGGAAAVAAAWALLHAGTLWLNAARDRDTGPVLLGRAGPVPTQTAIAGHAALALTPAVAAVAGPGPAGCAAAAAVLGVCYSAGPRPWKARPWLGPATNAIGYGVLTPLAGAWVVAAPGPRVLGFALAAALGTLGLSFLAQSFQADEDRARGDRTLVATHGPRACHRAGAAALRAGFACVLLGAAAGWLPRLVLLAAFAWLPVEATLRDWAQQPESPAPAPRLLRRLLLPTLAAVALALLAHAQGLARGGPVAGLDTATVPRWGALR
jgi:4-hydroxybenzoate polyprenyltransferase